MKRSVKLLLGVAGCLPITMLIAGWSLRRQYDQLDRRDPFASYHRQALPAFRILRLVGPNTQLTRILPGEPAAQASLHLSAEPQPYVTLESAGDTLTIRYTRPDRQERANAGDAFSWPPELVVTAPGLQQLLVNGATCQLSSFTQRSLTLRQTGEKAATVLTSCRIDSLRATIQHGSLLQTSGDNRIGRADVVLRDSSAIVLKQDRFGQLSLQAAPGASVNVPGRLLPMLSGR